MKKKRIVNSEEQLVIINKTASDATSLNEENEKKIHKKKVKPIKKNKQNKNVP